LSERRYETEKFTSIPPFFGFRTSRLVDRRETCYFDPSIDRNIKIIGQIKKLSDADSNLFKELKEPKPLLTQCFCKMKKEKHYKIPNNLGGGREVGQVLANSFGERI
jgi:hypothetical protein